MGSAPSPPAPPGVMSANSGSGHSPRGQVSSRAARREAPEAYRRRSPKASEWIISARRERWILPLEVFGMEPGWTSRTRAGRWPRSRLDALDDVADEPGHRVGAHRRIADLGDHVQALGDCALALTPTAAE